MAIRSIIFDLDGTLTDSGEGITKSIKPVLDHFGIPCASLNDLRFCVGPPLRDSFLRFGIAFEELDNAVAFYRKHYLAVGQYENQPYPGIHQLLERLMEDGNRLYIATSKPETMAADILQYFELKQYFTIICGAVPGGRSTKEEVIAHLLTQLDTRENLVMVGDTIYDVKGAAFHSFPCIAVAWGYGEVENMKAAGARIAETAEELYELLK